MSLNKTNFMDLKSAINIILRDLKEAEELIDELKYKPEHPVLQIELIKSKCKSAKDLIKIIGEIISESNIDNIVEEEKNTTVKKEIDVQVSRPADDVLELEDDVAEDEIKKQKAEKIVADKFTHLSSRVNEKVGDSRKLEGKTLTLPVTDLSKAIGINDRFYFIRELFNGKEESFRQTITSLNNATSREEATDILNETLNEMADSEPAHQLLELVERKLSAR
ncbi:MAG TPA: hypothetical protein DEQ09_12160 [Bacteroidales bacterium]|nr:hypothetical protein [Bacteroidales bacterium]